jgi:uncharacterized SAM-binding protein YcdF (DUF218 family)
MYFILSKILLFLILPFYWVVILLAIAVRSKERKRKQRFLTAAAILFYIFSIPFLLNSFMKIWDIRYFSKNNSKPYSCIIVLGGFSSGSGDVGPHFTSSSDRFIQGVKLMDAKQASHILITGGNGNLAPGGFREATWAKSQLEKLNVPDSVILIESNSKNTLENAKFSKVLLEKAHLAPPYLLVTSAFHMRRSLMIFKKAGIAVVPYPCDFMSSDTSFFISNFIPDADVLSRWNSYTKEVVGYVVNYFK